MSGAALCGFLLALGCTPAAGPAAMVLRPVESPEGGVIYGLTTVEGLSGQLIIALAGRALFMRRASEERWSPIKSQWPEATGRPGQSFAEALVRAEPASTTPLSRRFVGWGGALWALLRPQPGAPMTLMASLDGGERWELVPLPERIEDASTLRLEPRAQGMYLMGSDRLWSLDWAPSSAVAGARWEALELDGVELKAPDGEPLAPQLRHYLPAQPGRPWELLTVLRERLHVYKREGGEPWRHAGTLSTVDHQLHGVPGGPAMFLLAADGLWSSVDGAQWVLRQPPGEEALGERYEHLLVSPQPGEEARAVVLVGASSGAIWRSEDNGESWVASHAADPDRRAITSLVSAQDGALWAGTHGMGALRSQDTGRGWAQQIEGLHAAAPLTMMLNAEGKLLVGTWAGLYELTGGPTQPRWRQRHPRATSALLERDDGGLVSGTTGGALVLQRPGGEVSGREGRVVLERGGLRFEPAGAEGLEVPDSAVLRLLKRPDSAELFAMTRAQGFAVSPDGGESWTVRPPNEAFVSALEGSELTSMAVASQGFVALTSRSLKERSQEQLWVTETDGQSWRAANTFTAQDGGDDTLRLFAPASEPPGTLLFSQGHRLALSQDHGVTWRDLRGPWGSYPIVSLALQPEHATMLTTSRLRLGLHLFNAMDGEEPTVETHPLIWSYTAGEQREPILDARLSGRILYARTPTQLLWAAMPNKSGSLPNAPVMLFTFTMLTAMSAAAFGLLRWRLR
jgi:photosystem II stability/assembly factor-like uncharacterized protein